MLFSLLALTKLALSDLLDSECSNKKWKEPHGAEAIFRASPAPRSVAAAIPCDWTWEDTPLDSAFPTGHTLQLSALTESPSNTFVSFIPWSLWWVVSVPQNTFLTIPEQILCLVISGTNSFKCSVHFPTLTLHQTWSSFWTSNMVFFFPNTSLRVSHVCH